MARWLTSVAKWIFFLLTLPSSDWVTRGKGSFRLRQIGGRRCFPRTGRSCAFRSTDLCFIWVCMIFDRISLLSLPSRQTITGLRGCATVRVFHFLRMRLAGIRSAAWLRTDGEQSRLSPISPEILIPPHGLPVISSRMALQTSRQARTYGCMMPRPKRKRGLFCKRPQRKPLQRYLPTTDGLPTPLKKAANQRSTCSRFHLEKENGDCRTGADKILAVARMGAGSILNVRTRSLSYRYESSRGDPSRLVAKNLSILHLDSTASTSHLTDGHSSSINGSYGRDKEN